MEQRAELLCSYASSGGACLSAVSTTGSGFACFEKCFPSNGLPQCFPEPVQLPIIAYRITNTSRILSRPRKNFIDAYSRKRLSTCRLLNTRWSLKGCAGCSSRLSFEAMW